MRLAYNRAAVPREKLETLLNRISALHIVVVVRTVGFGAFCSVRRSAFCNFVIHVVVFLLFPAVAVGTTVLERTAVGVSAGFLLSAPDGALLLRVVVDVNFPPEVLPIMCVNTRISWMTLIFLVRIRTPHSFEVEQIKVNIALHFVQVLNRQLIFVMRKGAHFAELAGFDVGRVGLAKL